MRRLLLLLMLALAALPMPTLAAGKAQGRSPIAWQPWSDAVFARAKRENRFVLLDVEAVWCHWCHVMDATTYQDPRVLKLIRERYIPVKVDSDAHPEIARRYEDYGWPATVVFGPAGEEIAKRRGYVRPPLMVSMLEEIIRDPTPVVYPDSQPVTQFAPDATLAAAVRTQLEQRWRDTHDARLGGLQQDHKYIDRDTVEYGLLRAAQGDAAAGRMARQTLDGALALMDPAWGGIFQYATHGDWKNIHFEKIIQSQADALRLYATGWARFGDPRYKKAAQDIHRYLRAFMRSPQGAFYVSQDADLVKGQHSEGYFALNDADRRKQGIPAVDRNLYARENGWMIQALAAAYALTGERAYLDDALAAARWVQAHRALGKTGGFRHGGKDAGGPYLEDTLAMGRAMLALYEATADRAWLAGAVRAAQFIDTRFRVPQRPGFATSPYSARAVLKPKTVTDENIATVRFGNALARYTGDARHRAMAEHAMRYIATPAVALARNTEPGVLQAALELANDPTHITIVGAKGDATAARLYSAALSRPAVYRRIEWWDRAEGNMPNPDVKYPELPRAAAFLCTNGACSAPIHDTAELDRVAKVLEGMAADSHKGR
ncbi:MAG: thioredoxin domain-containing protein [Ramlibacter sp.]